MEYVILFLFAIGLVVFSWWRSAMRRRESDREAQAREGLRRQIEADPNNLAAYEMLADNLRRAGRVEEASTIYGEALARIDERTPDSRLLFQLQYKLRQIELDRIAKETRPSIVDNVLRTPRRSTEIVFCRDCGASNAPSAERCETCNSLLPIDGFGKSVAMGLRDLSTRRGLVEGLVIIVVVIVVLRIFAGLPGEVRGALTISGCIVAVLRLMWPGRS